MLFDFELISVSPLIMHVDDVEQSDRLKVWRTSPENRNRSVAGDDRSPPHTWKTYLASDGEHLVVPYEYIMASLRGAGARVKITGNRTYKSETQSGLLIPSESLPILVSGKPISAAAVDAIKGEFPEHAEAVKSLGFRLFVKRAKVGQSKHVRVRPRFDQWSLKGQIRVISEDIMQSTLTQIFEIAGQQFGIGDWRPNSPKSPGPFGRFSATLRVAKK